MPLDDVLLDLRVARTDRNRNYWIERAKLSGDEVAEARRADFLIVPRENFREGRDLFPNTTTDFIKALRTYPEGKLTSVAMTEDQ
jgi:hypothetical protein